MMDTYPNFFADIARRIGELGRQPYSSKKLFERHADRILFGTDEFPPQPGNYARYFRFLETADEYVPYCSDPVGDQGRWSIYGVDLPDEILRQHYRETALRLLGRT
jgi:predicted TIM-barrel fold metal-dependent hydrolase